MMFNQCILTPCFSRKLIGTFAQGFNICILELLCYLVYNEHVFDELSKGTPFDSFFRLIPDNKRLSSP